MAEVSRRRRRADQQEDIQNNSVDNSQSHSQQDQVASKTRERTNNLDPDQQISKRRRRLKNEEESNNESEAKDEQPKPEEQKKEIEQPYQERVQELQEEIESHVKTNSKWLEVQLSKEEQDFDGTQGRFCCSLGNRRGATLVHLFDRFFFIHFFRFPFAWLAKYRKKQLLLYARVRWWTWLVLTINVVASLSTFVILDCIPPNHGGHYYISIIYCLIGCLICIVDKHWTDVLMFNAKHQSIKTKPIHWMSSDSEPQFAYQNDPEALKESVKDFKERYGKTPVILPKSSLSESQQDINNLTVIQDNSNLNQTDYQQADHNLSNTNVQNLKLQENIDFQASRKKHKKRPIVDQSSINQADLELEDIEEQEDAPKEPPPLKRRKSQHTTDYDKNYQKKSQVKRHNRSQSDQNETDE